MDKTKIKDGLDKFENDEDYVGEDFKGINFI